MRYNPHVHVVCKTGSIPEWLNHEFKGKGLCLFFNRGPDVWEIGRIEGHDMIEHLIIGPTLSEFDREKVHQLKKQLSIPPAQLAKMLKQGLYVSDRNFQRSQDDENNEWKDFCRFQQRRLRHEKDQVLAAQAGTLKTGFKSRYF